MGSEPSTGGAHPGLPGEGGRRGEGFLRPDDLGGEVVELPVLLTGRQVAALEEVARRCGLTVRNCSAAFCDPIWGVNRGQKRNSRGGTR